MAEVGIHFLLDFVEHTDAQYQQQKAYFAASMQALVRLAGMPVPLSPLPAQARGRKRARKTNNNQNLADEGKENRFLDGSLIFNPPRSKQKTQHGVEKNCVVNQRTQVPEVQEIHSVEQPRTTEHGIEDSLLKQREQLRRTHCRVERTQVPEVEKIHSVEQLRGDHDGVERNQVPEVEEIRSVEQPRKTEHERIVSELHAFQFLQQNQHCIHTILSGSLHDNEKKMETQETDDGREIGLPPDELQQGRESQGKETGNQLLEVTEEQETGEQDKRQLDAEEQEAVDQPLQVNETLEVAEGQETGDEAQHDDEVQDDVQVEDEPKAAYGDEQVQLEEETSQELRQLSESGPLEEDEQKTEEIIRTENEKTGKIIRQLSETDDEQKTGEVIRRLSEATDEQKAGDLIWQQKTGEVIRQLSETDNEQRTREVVRQLSEIYGVVEDTKQETPGKQSFEFYTNYNSENGDLEDGNQQHIYDDYSMSQAGDSGAETSKQNIVDDSLKKQADAGEASVKEQADKHEYVQRNICRHGASSYEAKLSWSFKQNEVTMEQHIQLEEHVKLEENNAVRTSPQLEPKRSEEPTHDLQLIDGLLDDNKIDCHVLQQDGIHEEEDIHKDMEKEEEHQSREVSHSQGDIHEDIHTEEGMHQTRELSHSQEVSTNPLRSFNLVSNMRSFLPLVVPQQPAAAIANGKKEVRVKALEAAEAARKQEEKRAEERKMRKLEMLKRDKNDSLTIPSGVSTRTKRPLELKSKLDQQKTRKLEEEQRKKEEEWKKKELELNTKKRKKEEIEKKEREDKRRKIDDLMRMKKEQEEKLRADLEDKEQRRKALEEAEKERKAMEEEMRRGRRLEKEREIERRRKAEEEAKASWLATKEADRKRREEVFQRMKVLEREQRKHIDKNELVTCTNTNDKYEIQREKSLGLLGHAARIPKEAAQRKAVSLTLLRNSFNVKHSMNGTEIFPGTPAVKNTMEQWKQSYCTPLAGEFVNEEDYDEEEDDGPVSYEISPYKNSSDEEDEDEEESRPSKPIPRWARKDKLLPQLARQAHIDPDKIFRSANSCSLNEVFGTTGNRKRKDFAQRAGSGDWTFDIVSWKEELMYKKSMGFL